MGFWDEPTTILNPATGTPLSGKQYITPETVYFPVGNVLLGRGGSAGPGSTVPTGNGTWNWGAGGIRQTSLEGRQITVPIAGATSARPTVAFDGAIYWDTTLNKPVFRKAASATGWVDATGADV